MRMRGRSSGERAGCSARTVSVARVGSCLAGVQTSRMVPRLAERERACERDREGRPEQENEGARTR